MWHIALHAPFFMTVTFRPTTPEDDAFLFQVYISSREAEFQHLNWTQLEKEAFLYTQFLAQRADYRRRFPGADYAMVLFRQVPVGYLYVARSDVEIRALDIAVLPERRNEGIGSEVLHLLMAEARQKGQPLSYMVMRFNQDALRLYQRLGFQIAGEYGSHYLLQYRPPV